MNTSMARAANINTLLQLIATIIFLEVRAAMDFAGYEMMKGQGNLSITQRADT